MNLNRRVFSTALVSTGLGASILPAVAQTPAPTEGVQYSRLQPPVPVQSGTRIEVLEFFSYACPHCSAFEPTLEAWVKTLPADVSFRRVPVPFLTNAEGFQRLYYTLETLGKLDAVHRKVFTAIHVDRVRLDKPADMAELAAKNGIDSAKFLDVYNSFSVANSATKAKRLVGEYKLESVPGLAVHGKYLTSPSQAGSSENTLATANYLIAQLRKG